MMPRRVRIAILIAILCHGLFILSARYRLSYDAYTHMLFANHYAEDWFSLWETRWYTGFTVVSYPPLTHQLIALFIPVLGFEKAFALVLWAVTSLYPFGVYAFSRVFTGRTSASYAALASAILLPIYVTAHIFGQLPFLASTLAALFGAASLDRYLREGGPYNLALSAALIAVSMAMHHATLMAHPFLILAVTVNRLLQRQNNERHSSKIRWLIFKRLFLFGALAGAAGILVVWPFWQWGMDQTMQTPIDHLSRHNFLADPLAPAIFFLPLYGPLAAVIPFLFRRWPSRFAGLLISFAVLFLLGLGGTTPLPRFLFGGAWEWLTYDRFAFWACLTLTPLFGTLFIRLQRKWRNRFISGPAPAALRRNIPAAAVFSVFAATALGAWFTPFLFPIQPRPIDMKPIVEFLEDGDRSQWRYLTFGFGDQFAYLNLLTEAETIDGSYHTARRLPELRRSGIGQIDTAYWASKGIPAIEPILDKSGDYGVRWGFVNPEVVEAIPLTWGKIYQSPFIPVLEKHGWVRVETLENGVIVYENPNAALPVPSTPPETEPLASFSWGVFPLLSFAAALSLGAFRLAPGHAERVLRGIHAFLVGLIPISLGFWYYRVIAEFPHEGVYFTYTHALFFVTDALVLLAVVLWLSAKTAQAQNAAYKSRPLSAPLLLFFGLCLLTTVSILWSRDWRVSLYVSLHFWLIFLFALSLREWTGAWQSILYGLCAALSVQLIAGWIGFGAQSTAFLAPLGMNWPGALDPSARGASVVQGLNGLRVLRAYGTLPHPNILGGFVILLLLGPAGLFLANKRPNYAALLLFGFGAALLALTFSRSAWLGCIAFLSLLVLKSRRFGWKRILPLVLVFLLTVLIVLYPLRELALARVGGTSTRAEQMSAAGRAWLTEQALNMIRQRPLTGVGSGSFVIALADSTVEGALIEPPHNVVLLAGAELGVFGLLLATAWLAAAGLAAVRAQTPKAILAAGILAAFGVVSLFDHYLWTLAPGRVMLALSLGVWAGQDFSNG